MNLLPLQPFLEKALGKMGLKKVADASEMRHIFDNYGKDILGEELFSHCRFLFFKNHTIYLAGDSSHWAQHLFVQRHHILEEMSRRFPDLGIRGVHVQVQHAEKES